MLGWVWICQLVAVLGIIELYNISKSASVCVAMCSAWLQMSLYKYIIYPLSTSYSFL